MIHVPRFFVPPKTILPPKSCRCCRCGYRVFPYMVAPCLWAAKIGQRLAEAMNRESASFWPPRKRLPSTPPKRRHQRDGDRRQGLATAQAARRDGQGPGGRRITGPHSAFRGRGRLFLGGSRAGNRSAPQGDHTPGHNPCGAGGLSGVRQDQQEHQQGLVANVLSISDASKLADTITAHFRFAFPTSSGCSRRWSSKSASPCC